MKQKTRRVRSRINARSKPNGKAGRPAKKTRQGRARIQSKEVYELTMEEIDALMKKGEENLSQKEFE
jgi:hypothetical protein